MRTKVCSILAKWDAQSVENMVGPGMPDIVYIGGWIETKKTKAFPKRPETPVTLDHEVLETQKVWMARHHRKGGTVHTLTQIGQEFFLHEGEWARQWLGNVDRETLTRDAVLHCKGWTTLTKKLPKYLFPHA